jgi:hypothetical protein
MASLIEAYIFDGAPETAAVPDGLPAVRLTAELTMLPLTQEALGHLGAADPNDDRIKPGWVLRRAAATLGELMSADRTVLYVFAEAFGGPGAQEAVAWREGRLFFGPIGTCDLEVDREPGYQVATRRDGAVNRGLRAIGVHAAPGTDEYESVGLTRHRMIEDWAALSGHELHDAFTKPANRCGER